MANFQDGASFRINLTNVDQVQEELQSYQAYKVAMAIKIYWPPILVPCGLVGNVLSFCVMLRPSNRRMSTCIYMWAISINDTMMLLLAFHEWLITAVNTHVWNEWECRIGTYFIAISLQQATFQVKYKVSSICLFYLF